MRKVLRKERALKTTSMTAKHGCNDVRRYREWNDFRSQSHWTLMEQESNASHTQHACSELLKRYVDLDHAVGALTVTATLSHTALNCSRRPIIPRSGQATRSRSGLPGSNFLNVVAWRGHKPSIKCTHIMYYQHRQTEYRGVYGNHKKAAHHSPLT